MPRQVWRPPRGDRENIFFEADEFWKLHEQFSQLEEATEARRKKTCNTPTTRLSRKNRENK
jgi:hypothetical protein